MKIQLKGKKYHMDVILARLSNFLESPHKDSYDKREKKAILRKVAEVIYENGFFEPEDGSND